jgi:hypothetical protein
MKWQSHSESKFYGKQNKTNEYTYEELVCFLKEIWRQIRISDKMACALNFRGDIRVGESNGNPFVGMSTRMPLGKNGNWQIYILLNRATDTYKVSLIQYKDKFIGGDFHIEDEQEDVYCDDLSETIYRMCNK